MKMTYVKPAITGMEICERECFLAGTLEHGIYDPGNAMGKEGSIEEETGIPDKFSNIWGDEEDED